MILHIPHDTSGRRTFRRMSTCTKSCQVTLASTSSPFTTRCIAPMTSADCSCTCHGILRVASAGECRCSAKRRRFQSMQSSLVLRGQPLQPRNPDPPISPSRHPATSAPSKCSKKLTCSLISSKPHPAKILAWMACQRKLML